MVNKLSIFTETILQKKNMSLWGSSLTEGTQLNVDPAKRKLKESCYFALHKSFQPCNGESRETDRFLEL